jgi:hypothetical protein
MDKVKALWAKFRSLKMWQKAVVIFVAYVLFASITGFGSSSDSSDSATTEASVVRSYPVEYLRHAVVNPATISVAFNVTNDGTEPVKPSCKVKMQDASGTYKGWDIVEFTKDIAPNQSLEVVAQLTITKEGAEYANRFSADCTATTTDSGTNAGKSVEISEIRNLSATDSSEGWYWIASFKANQPPRTQMDCSVQALNSSGKIVTTTSYRAVALNDGTVTEYGGSGKQLVDATKSLVLSIKSFKVKCTL